MDNDVSERLLDALNEQGYLFQQACEHELRMHERGTKWEVKASEYPVSFEKLDTRIDLVLQSTAVSSPELYALIECKRVGPSRCWVLGATKNPGGTMSLLGLESEGSYSHGYKISAVIKTLRFGVFTDTVTNWLEVRVGRREQEARTSTPQNIENAFGQVLKGIEGLAQEQREQRSKNRPQFAAFFIPVVVTTAKLYVGYYQAKDINIISGKIDQNKISFGPKGQATEEIPWVQVDYGSGGGIAPKRIPENFHDPDPSKLLQYSTRSIFIVNSARLSEFFFKLNPKT